MKKLTNLKRFAREKLPPTWLTLMAQFTEEAGRYPNHSHWHYTKGYESNLPVLELVFPSPGLLTSTRQKYIFPTLQSGASIRGCEGSPLNSKNTCKSKARPEGSVRNRVYPIISMQGAPGHLLLLEDALGLVWAVYLH